jgi:hypothetical protein
MAAIPTSFPYRPMRDVMVGAAVLHCSLLLELAAGFPLDPHSSFLRELAAQDHFVHGSAILTADSWLSRAQSWPIGGLVGAKPPVPRSRRVRRPGARINPTMEPIPSGGGSTTLRRSGC